MEDGKSTFPNPFEFPNYEEFQSAVNEWKSIVSKNDKNSSDGEMATAFLRSPHFPLEKVRSIGSFPKPNNVNEIFRIILKAKNVDETKNLNKPYSRWIYPPTPWISAKYHEFPDPTRFLNEKDFEKSAEKWAECTNSVIKETTEKFDESGTVTRSGENVQISKRKNYSINYPHPTKILDKFNIGRKDPVHYSKPAVQEKQEFQYPSFYSEVMKKCKAYEEKPIIDALRCAYESSPYLTHKLWPPRCIEEFCKFGCSSPRPVPLGIFTDIEQKKTTYEQLLKEKRIMQLVSMGPSRVAFDDIKTIALAAVEEANKKENTMLKNLRILHFVTYYFFETSRNPVHFETPLFEEVQRIHNPLVQEVHDSCARITLFSALYAMLEKFPVKRFVADVCKMMENTAKEMHQLISKNGNKILEALCGLNTLDGIKVALFIFSVQASLPNSASKKFSYYFGFKWCTKVRREAPEYLYKFNFVLLTDRTLLVSIISDIILNIDNYIDDIDLELTQTCSCLFQLQGNFVPVQFLDKPDFIAHIVSTFIERIRDEKTVNDANCIYCMIKMVMRAKKLKTKKNFSHWEIVCNNICGIITSFIGDVQDNEEMSEILIILCNAIASLASENGFLDLLKLERSTQIIELASHKNYRVASIGFKIMSRLLRFQRQTFMNMTNHDNPMYPIVSKQFQNIDGPLIIDVIELIYKFVEVAAKPEKSSNSSTTQSYFMAVALVPQDVLFFAYFLKDCNFIVPMMFKRIKFFIKDPFVSSNMFKVTKFRVIMKTRKTIFKIFMPT